MADVPWWVLVLNTFATGSFALGGTFIVPRSQREAAQREVEQAAVKLLREKAESIFEQIAVVKQSVANHGDESLAQTKAGDYSLDAGHTYQIPFSRLKAHVSTYFPNCAIPFDSHEARIRPIIDDFVARSSPLPPHTAPAKMLEIEMQHLLKKSVLTTTGEVEKLMLAAVRSLAPSMTSKVKTPGRRSAG